MTLTCGCAGAGDCAFRKDRRGHIQHAGPTEDQYACSRNVNRDLT